MLGDVLWQAKLGGHPCGAAGPPLNIVAGVASQQQLLHDGSPYDLQNSAHPSHSPGSVLRVATAQAILPLRGKILNVERKDDAALYKNQEIASLIVALGLGTRGSSGSGTSGGKAGGKGSKVASRRGSSSVIGAEAAGDAAAADAAGDAAGSADPLKGLR